MFEDGSVPRSVDQQLIRAAASDKRSPRELSNAVGKQLSPERARMRLEELLDDSDYLTYIQERRLLILNLRELLDTTSKHALKGNDSDARRMYLDTLKAIADRLDKTQINVDDVSTKLSSAFAQVMAEAIGNAFDAIPKALQTRGMVLDMEELEGVFESVLPLAIERVEANTHVGD